MTRTCTTARRVGLAVLVGLLMGSAIATPARGDATGEACFDAGIAEVEALLAKEWWPQGQSALAKLLESHKDEAYVKVRRLEIEDLARRLAFGRAFPPPKPRDVLSGKVLSYFAPTGKIRVKYTPDTAADFDVVRGKLMVLPVRFKGPFTLTVKGKRYPIDPKDCPQVLVGMEPDPKTLRPQAWRIAFGSSPQEDGRRREWMPVEIVHYDGKKEETIERAEKYYAKPGARYKLVVTMMKTKLTASVNGRSIGKARKPDDIYGQIAFVSKTWTEALVEGTVEPSWVQGQIDTIVQANLEAFRASYDPKEILPAWLLESKVTPRPHVARKQDRYPGDLSPPARDRLGRIVSKIDAGDGLGALLALEELDEGSVPPAARAFVAARAEWTVGRLPEALKEVRASLELEPTFLPARLLEGHLLAAGGDWDDAAAAFAQAMGEHPESPLAYEEAAVAALRHGRPEAVAKIAYAATAKRAGSPKLGAYQRAALKADRGPTWARVYDHESEHYHVFSDMDHATCREAARKLELANRAFRDTLPFKGEDDDRKFKVYLFGGRAGFDTYQADLGILGSKLSPSVAGLYNTWLKQLLIWNLPRRDAMMRTVKHEGFHQYLDRFLDDPPVWFNEGMAEYYELGEPSGRTLRLGQVEMNHVAVLASKPRIPLATFLFMSPQSFYKAAPLSYAQAWALIHMLRHGDLKYRGRYAQLIKDLETMPGHRAVLKALPPTELDRIEKDLDRYLRKLAKP